MWTLHSHEVDLKVIITDNFPPIVDSPICLRVACVCPLTPSQPAVFLEEAAVDFSRKKERNYSYVLSSPWIMLSFLETSNSSCQRWRVQ